MNAIGDWKDPERRKASDNQDNVLIKLAIIETKLEHFEEKLEEMARAIKSHKSFKDTIGDFLYKVICGAFIMAVIGAAAKFFSSIIEKLTK